MTQHSSAARAVTRIAIAVFVAGGALLLSVRPVAASVNGPCTASGFETSGSVDPKAAAANSQPSIQINSQDEWHVHFDSYISGVGTSTPELKEAHVGIVEFGFPITIINASGKGHGGSAGPYKVSDYASYGREIAVMGDAGPPDAVCSGALLIIVDDKNAATTVLGGGGLAIGVVGAAGVAAVALRKGGAA